MTVQTVDDKSKNKDKLKVVQHLPTYMRNLLAATKYHANLKNYKYSWITVDGNILVRKDDDSRIIPIRNWSDLDKLQE